jgi:hypothetical protein
MTNAKRVLVGVIGVYLLAAMLTTVAEATGTWRRCGCEADCWCRRPGLAWFRWVTPKRAHHQLDPRDKEDLAQARETD